MSTKPFINSDLLNPHYHTEKYRERDGIPRGKFKVNVIIAVKNYKSIDNLAK